MAAIDTEVLKATEQGIIHALNAYDRPRIAKRVAFLCELASDDPSEDSIKLGSLRNLAQFVVSNPSLPHPQISVSPRGHAVAEWGREYGILAMEFTSDWKIRYAALPRKTGHDYLRISGEGTASDVIEAAAPFVK